MKKVIILFCFILSGCSITYEVPKCELMLRGEKCLSDHRCCNLPQVYHQAPPIWWYWNKPHYNKTVIINKPNKPNNKPNKPNVTRGHRK